MNTPWHEYSDNPAGITSFYDEPPSLENVVIREFAGSAYFDQYSLLLWLDLKAPPPSLPDLEMFSVGLHFRHLEELRLSAKSEILTTTLTIDQLENQLIRVKGTGEFNVDFVCKSFMIESISKTSSDQRKKRTRELSSYYKLWNSCLIELLEMGYEFALQGYPDAVGGVGSTSFTATRDSVRLVGHNPVELLGLATLHMRYPEFDHESNIWQMPGPDLIQGLIQDWEQRWYKKKT